MDRSLDRALGAVWLLGFDGTKPADDFLRVLDRYRPPALILFRDNLAEGAASLAPLRKRLEEAAAGRLFLFLDEEGGWIRQLDTAPWPSPRAQAMAGADTVHRCHEAMAARARQAGAEVLIAPLADLDDGALNPVIGTRSFGPDAEETGLMVAAAVDGMLAGGALPVLKHFPGHGDSVEDSHLTLPEIPADRAEALIPFRHGLEAGAPAVMTAHLRLAGQEDPRPATFRPDMFRELLGRELGFEGLVVTDALEMLGAAVIPPEERALAALAAGCHLLCLARWAAGGEVLLDGLAAGRSGLRQRWLDEAAERWEIFAKALPAAPSRVPDPPDAATVEARACFIPGASGASDPPDPIDLTDVWDGGALDLEFGPLGSWREDEFDEALDGLPVRKLGPADPLRAATYLWVGRKAPSPERLAELAALAESKAAPGLIVCGPWAWSLSHEARLASAASTPAGVRALLDSIADAQDN